MKLLFLLFIFPGMTLCIFGQSRTESLLAEAELNLKNNNIDVSLSKVREALTIEPDNVKALVMEINLIYLKNDYKEAGDLAEKAIDKHPGEDELMYLKGLINIAKNKYERAIDDFNSIIEKNTYPSMFKVYLNRGIAYLYIPEYVQATSDFTKSIELNSNNASAYHSRGMLNYQLKDYDAAVADFKKALEINDNNPETHFNLGMCYFRMEETDKACPHFHTACKGGNLNACKMVMMECAKELPK